MNYRKKIVWVTWERQIRNQSMSTRLGADFFQIPYGKPRLIRYIKSAPKTLKILYLNRHSHIFVQNPSLVLSLIAVIFKKIFGIHLIIDAHNSGVFPTKNLQFLADFVNRNANHVIVTNDGLAAYIRKIGGSPVVLPDPLPHIATIKDNSSKWNTLTSPSALVICSWASDEPYCDVILAAASIPEVTFYITGNSKGREQKCNSSLPKNIVLTGFVSENDYHLLLENADIIIDLTTREDCLVCGAYEAISAGKPLILSNTRALKNYFGDSALYVDNDAPSICTGIKTILQNYKEASAIAKSNSIKVEEKWGQLFSDLQKLLQ